MSSILKALKKLEDEKAAHQPDSLKIDSDILRGEGSRRQSTTVLILAALLLFTGGSIATYLYMKKDSSPPVEVANKTPDVPISMQSRPPLAVPGTKVTDVKIEKLPASIAVVPAQGLKSPAPPVAKTKRQSAAVKSAPGGTRRQHAQTGQQQKTIPPAAPPIAPEVVTTVPLLRVNGIAHQGGAADNVAVINGVPVSDGAIIEGVRVEDIQKDRVRFSYKGETFEIPLGRSNR